MLSALALYAALLRPAALSQAAQPDTTRQFRGYAGLTFAWGTLELRKGTRLRDRKAQGRFGAGGIGGSRLEGAQQAVGRGGRGLRGAGQRAAE